MIKSIHLPGKIENEEVILFLRRDLFILLKSILFCVLLALIPPVLIFMVASGDIAAIFNKFLENHFLVLSLSAYYLFLWLFFFFSFIDYYLDVWVVTNQRIINIEQNGFFARVISEQRLYRVQDVTSEINGFFPTFLGYGDLHIQTAGQKSRFVFEQIPRPNIVRDQIIKLTEKHKVRKLDEEE